MFSLDSFDGFIFDYGGVLAHHQTLAEQAHMADIAGLTVEQFEELYWRDRADYDKGAVTGIAYWHAIGLAADKVLTLEQVGKLVELDTVSWMNFDEPMWHFVRELRASGKRLAILSNMPEDLGEAIKARTPRFQLFDHVTLSYEIKSIKPEAPIYQDCLAGIGTAPNRTLFFDDKVANVRGAEMLGIQAIEFLNLDDVIRRVRH